ncbi:helix-turn-helix domain-containing protein [Phyllobacterium myrsinacearum]|uniref:helix-turn-helix domain-containing protein n=1 Tax=Phyllobacterium myrsinacearum TaxID=28101 RepID=UPI0032B1A844
MGLILMSERELHRIEVLSEVVEGGRTLASAAIVLSLSVRQVQRILRTFCFEGAAALRHRGRGRRSNNRINDGVRDLALQLVRERYADFGPTLAAEKLSEQGFSVSRETLRKWMAKDGLWLSRKQRRTFRQPRLRRECDGELIQADNGTALVAAAAAGLGIAYLPDCLTHEYVASGALVPIMTRYPPPPQVHMSSARQVSIPHGKYGSSPNS